LFGSQEHADFRRERGKNDVPFTLGLEDSFQDMIDKCVDFKGNRGNSGFHGFVKSGVFFNRLRSDGPNNHTHLSAKAELTYFDVEAYRVRQLGNQFFERCEGVLDGLSPSIRLETFVLEVHGELHSIVHMLIFSTIL
jgi:hypothetical protein